MANKPELPTGAAMVDLLEQILTTQRSVDLNSIAETCGVSESEVAAAIFDAMRTEGVVVDFRYHWIGLGLPGQWLWLLQRTRTEDCEARKDQHRWQVN